MSESPEVFIDDQLIRIAVYRGIFGFAGRADCVVSKLCSGGLSKRERLSYDKVTPQTG